MNFFGKMFGALFGGGKTTERAIEVTDEAFHTAQERVEEDRKDTTEARLMQFHSHSTMFDVFVDGLNRLQRPGWGIFFFGGCAKWWELPEIPMNGFWASMLILYLTFLFGGRAVLKDLPAAIQLMRDAWVRHKR